MADSIHDIRAGLKVSDTQFDKLFDREVRDIARTHWTPFEVAAAATSLLTNGHPANTMVCVLDVGSNVGKFCMIGALLSTARFVGVEIRRDLVDIARSVAREHHIERVRFLWSNMADIDWSEYQGIYLYNPFYENIEDSVRIDDKISLNPKLYETYLHAVESKLTTCSPGTRVVTYYGFGGKVPDSYTQLQHEFFDLPNLELWVKS